MRLIIAHDVDYNTMQNSEALCGATDAKHYLREREVEHSVTLDLLPPPLEHLVPCRTILTATGSSGFIVRLHRSKSRTKYGSAATSRNMDNTMTVRNSTRSCPLSINSTTDPLAQPWRIDPCQLEEKLQHATAIAASAVVFDPVRLLSGRLKILWNHGGHAPNYRLIVTTLMKGNNCNHSGQHACLKIDGEIMFCISDSLACDGIRHCPDGIEYDSDEDPLMCMKHSNIAGGSTNSAIDHRKKMTKKPYSTDYTISTATSVEMPSTSSPVDELVATKVVDHSVAIEKAKAKERQSLTRGLSRYGPWGYLMLGMLLCGGALLICGLWECCCRTKKPVATSADGITVNASSTSSDLSAGTTNAYVAPVEPPNYDEIDPPPSYSALFPNQKLASDEVVGVHEDVSNPAGAATLDTNATTTNQ